MNKIRIILVEISILLVSCFCMTAPPAAEDWRVLDSTNLKTLNRETRKALLDLITKELEAVRQTITTLRPQLLQCQNRTTAVMGKCMDCVDNMCQDRLRECNGKANVVVPSNGGVSVSGQTDSQGRHVVTVCALLKDNSQSCQTIMNPDGVLVSSIENMGDNLMVHLRGAVNDMGGNSVGTFVNGMQTFIGSYRPLSGNGSNIPETELISLLSNMSSRYNTINQQIRNQISNMGEQIQHGMKLFKNVIGNDPFSSHMSNQMDKLFSSINNAFNINPTTPFTKQQQTVSSTSNIFQQPWQMQQQRNGLNLLYEPSSPFSFQESNKFQQKSSTQDTMFRAPPTTESNFYNVNQNQRLNERTTPPSTLTGPSTPSYNNPPLPSVLNIDSIIGSSDRQPIPNVVNINSPVGTVHGENVPNINIDSFTDHSRKNINSNNVNMDPSRLMSRNSNTMNMDSSRLVSGLEKLMENANGITGGQGANKKVIDLEQLISRTRNITQGGTRKKQMEPFDQMNANGGNRQTLERVSQNQGSGLNFDTNHDFNRGFVPRVLNIDSIIGGQSGSQIPNLEGLSSLLNGGQIPDVVNIGSNIGTQDIVTERPELPPNFDFLSNTNAGQSNQRISSSAGIPNVMNLNSMIGTQNTGQSSGTNQNGVEVIRNNPMVSSILGDNFASNMNNLASNLQHSFSDMFGGGGFFGRKKRSVEKRRVKRSHLTRPGGVPVDSNPSVGLITQKKKKPISKDMYTKTNQWYTYTKEVLPNSVPVRVNHDEGISVRSKKSAVKTLLERMGDRKRNLKSRVTWPSKSNDAGGLMVYNNYLFETTTVPSKVKSLFSPEMMAMRTNTRVVKRINPRPQSTTTERTRMSTYQTSPLKLELERIVRALEAKAKERSLSVYEFNPNHATSTIGSTKVIIPKEIPKSTTALQTMDTTQVETTTESMKNINEIKNQPLQIQRPESLQRKEVRTALHSSVSSLKNENVIPHVDTGRQIETTTAQNVRQESKPIHAIPDSVHQMDILEVPTETPMDVMRLINSISADAVSKMFPETPGYADTGNSASMIFTTTTEPPYLTDPKSAAGGFYQHNMFQDNLDALPLGLGSMALDNVPPTTTPTTTTPSPDIRLPSNIINQRDCGIIYLNATACLPYRQMCSACADHIDSRKGDILQKVCGGKLVDHMVNLQTKMTSLQTIYYQVITSSDIITKVEFDRSNGDMMNLSFPKLRVMATISSRIVNFMADFPLLLLDMPGTGSQMAKQIWRLWNNGQTQ